MSDQDDKLEQVDAGSAQGPATDQAEELQRAEEMQGAEELQGAEEQAEPERRGGEAAQGRSSSAVGWVALLLVLLLALGLGGAVTWLLPRLQADNERLQSRLDQLESDSAAQQIESREEIDLDGLEDGLRSELRDGLDAVESQLESQVESQLQEQSARVSESLRAMENQLAEQRAELNAFNANDRKVWLMAEAEYLLRLADQRLVMAGDTVAARALLSSADSVLREIDDPALHSVRAAVAADLAAVRAVPTIDTEGIYLRLAALIEQADKLVIFQLPEQEAGLQPAPAEDWRGRLRQGYEAALEKLSDYLVIRRRDVPMQALMDPQWEGLVRQNLRMLLEQAQVALLSGNQTLYRESLERAGQWVEQFRESDAAAAAAMEREIGDLGAIRIAVAMPDLARSLRALDEAAEQRRAGE